MILVTGPNGFVGHKIMEVCEDVIPCPSLRNASEEDIKRIVEESGADTIIHTAAISDISACIADPDASYHANVMIPLYLAKAALTTGPAAISFQRGQPLFLIQHLKPLQTSPK